MKGKHCVVTGANSGIGRVTAAELARRGAAVILVCRSAEKGNAAAAAIREETGNDAVDLVVSDLSTLAGMRAVARAVRERCARLDVLVNNAGVSLPERKLTEDGFERMYALNHLGYFVLTCELAGLLRAAAPARVVSVSSDAHRGGRVDFDNLNGERKFSALRQYCHTKLMNVLFTKELARRLAGSGVTANCLHPGSVRTGFAQDEPGILGTLVKYAPFLLSPTKGARTSIHVACSPELEGVSGEYFVRCRPTKPSARARDAETAHRLWARSVADTGTDLAPAAEPHAGSLGPAEAG